MGDRDNPITSLVDAAASGDEPAWRELVDRYTPLLTSVLRRFGLGAVETQDVAQTVWLRVVEHLGSLREPQALPSWLISIAKREALRCVSERQRSVPYDPLDPSWLPSAAEGAEPDAELLRAERHEVLLAGLAELPARQRELLILLTADPPLSYAQISRRAGIRPGSIGPTRARALDRLRGTSAVRAYLASREMAGDETACLDRAAVGDADGSRKGYLG
jgi:RNA polymerase sigma factor (sigma-70 family)